MTQSDTRPSWREGRWFVLSGILLIVIGIAANPFTLAHYFSPDGVLNRTTKLLIALFEVACIAGGLWLIARRRWPVLGTSNIGRAYGNFAILFLNTVLGFIILNLLVAWLRPRDHVLPIDYIPVQELMARDPALFHSLYPGLSDHEIFLREHPPNITAHPVLEFMEHPTVSEDYNVGFENMRYTRYVNAANAKEKINGSTWVFGGSTTFGHGVADDETIASNLNRLDSTAVYVNFGVQAYDENLEIEKLLLLLKKGYRPSRVIFIDGLNDITEMNQMNFKPEEMPCRLYDAYRYRSNIESVIDPDRQFIVRKLPVFDYLFELVDEAKMKKKGAPDPNHEIDLDNPDELYHSDPVLDYVMTAKAGEDYDAAMKNIGAYKRKITTYYRMNDDFLRQLSEAFHFRYSVFLQPLGNLSPENPFHRDPRTFRDDLRYKYCVALLDTVRAAIASHALPGFRDITTADRACPGCYVDFTHYGPALCRTIAQVIVEDLRTEGRN